MEVLTLRPEQKRAALFLLNHQRSLLRAPPGFGKTLAAYTAAGILKQKGLINSIVIVAKPKEVTAWEAHRNNPYHLTFRSLKSSQDWINFRIQEQGIYDVTILSSSMIKDHESLFYKICHNAQLLILDEVHTYRNYKATLSKIVRGAVSVFKGRIFSISASPFYTEIENAYSVMAVTQPNVFPSWEWFSDTFVEYELKQRRDNRSVVSGQGAWRSGTGVIQYKERTGYKNLDLLHKMLDPYVFYSDESDFTINCKIKSWTLQRVNVYEYNQCITGKERDVNCCFMVQYDKAKTNATLYRKGSEKLRDMKGRLIPARDVHAGDIIRLNNVKCLVQKRIDTPDDADPLKCLIDSQKYCSTLSEKMEALYGILRDGIGSIIFCAYHETVEVLRSFLTIRFRGRQVISLSGKDTAPQIKAKLTQIRWSDAIVLITTAATQSLNMYSRRAIIYEPATMVSGKLEQFVGRLTRADASNKEIDVIFLIGRGTVEAYTYSRARYMMEQVPGGMLHGLLPELPEYAGRTSLLAGGFNDLKDLLLWKTL